MIIVHISDLHLGSFNYRYHILDRAIKSINLLKPDYIFFTGDLVNNHAWELKGWASVLKQLAAKKGKFAVLGNHDYGDYSQWKTNKAKQDNFNSITINDINKLINKIFVVEHFYTQILFNKKTKFKGWKF